MNIKHKLIESTIKRNGERVIQGRSKEGKLLIEKSRDGYELKCPRSKEVYLITYEDMLADFKIFGHQTDTGNVLNSAACNQRIRRPNNIKGEGKNNEAS